MPTRTPNKLTAFAIVTRMDIGLIPDLDDCPMRE
jgi:hypothetical protein